MRPAQRDTLHAETTRHFVALPENRSHHLKGATMKWFLIAGVIGVPAALGVGGWLYWNSTDVLEDTIWDLEFVPIKLPSKNYTIGSIVHVNGSGRIKRTVCEAAPALTDDLIRDSSTEDIVRSELRHSQFAFMGKAVNRMNAKLNEKAVREVTLEFVDVRVREIADDASLNKIQHVLLNDGNCREAVVRLLQAHEYVCQSTALLEASVRYQVNYDRETTASGQVTEAQIKNAVLDVTNDLKISGLGEKVEERTDEQSNQAGTDAQDSVKAMEITASKGTLNYGMRIHPLCLTLKDGIAKPLPTNDFERVLAWLKDEVSEFWA